MWLPKISTKNQRKSLYAKVRKSKGKGSVSKWSKMAASFRRSRKPYSDRTATQIDKIIAGKVSYAKAMKSKRRMR